MQHSPAGADLIVGKLALWRHTGVLMPAVQSSVFKSVTERNLNLKSLSSIVKLLKEFVIYIWQSGHKDFKMLK